LHVPLAQLGDVELYYEETGSGEPLLLVMGLGADSRAWLRQIPEFSRCHRTIAFDNRGVGRSSKPPGPYAVRQMAEDAVRLLDRLAVARTHVLGVSMGGMIAQEIAINHPDRIGALVLACTYPEPDADVEHRRRFTVQQLGGSVSEDGEVTFQVSAIDPLAIFQHMLPVVFSERFIREELAPLMQHLTGGLAYGFSLEAILGQTAAVLSHRATDRLHHIASPTLVLTGTDDLLVPPHHSDVLAERIPGARLVKLPGGTHGFNLEMPERFNAEVLRFLAAHPFAAREPATRDRADTSPPSRRTDT
jgi:3-oxoadipate enol-lactonase